MSKHIPFIKKLTFNNKIIDNDFDVIESGYENQPIFRLGYHYYTAQVREKMENNDLRTRKFYLIGNEFENDVPDYKDNLNNRMASILKFDDSTKIVSRDLYKLWEMIVYFDLANNDKNLTSVSLSDNGGFLQCISHFRNNYLNSKGDTYCYQGAAGSTEISECLKGNTKNNKFVKLNDSPLEQMNNTGFLSNVTALETFIKVNKLSDVDLVTGNGTVEYKKDSNMEYQLYTLLLGEIITALSIQKDKGDFVLRIEDCFTFVTIKFLNILSDCYNNVYICKPLFSRSFNNERYIVCKKFILKGTAKTNLINKLKKLLNNMNDIIKKKKYIFDIITDYTIDPQDIKNITNINLHLVANEHININKVTEYKNKNNYFGERYHKFRDNQIEANKWWEETFIKSKHTEFGSVRENLFA